MNFEREDLSRERIPIRSVIDKLDAYLNREDYESAHRLLEYWRDEARRTGDLRGEVAIQSEIMGFSRRIGDRKGGLAAVWRGFELVEELGLSGSAAGTASPAACSTASCSRPCSMPRAMLRPTSFRCVSSHCPVATSGSISIRWMPGRRA